MTTDEQLALVADLRQSVDELGRTGAMLDRVALVGKIRKLITKLGGDVEVGPDRDPVAPASGTSEASDGAQRKVDEETLARFQRIGQPEETEGRLEEVLGPIARRWEDDEEMMKSFASAVLACQRRAISRANSAVRELHYT